MIPNEKKVKKILARHGVKFSYLFGSRAGTHAVASSDYDVAVFLGSGTPRSRFSMRLQLMDELQTAIASAVDVVVLDDVRSTVLRNEVVRSGKLLYVKDQDARIDFELRTMREYEEFAPFLDAYNKAYIAKVSACASSE